MEAGIFILKQETVFSLMSLFRNINIGCCFTLYIRYMYIFIYIALLSQLLNERFVATIDIWHYNWRILC